MNKEIEITPQDIAKALNELLEEKEQLQQENKQLKEELYTTRKVILEEQQQRIDKAIKYIKQDNINVEEEKWVKSEILKKYRYSVKSKLLDILGDKE